MQLASFLLLSLAIVLSNTPFIHAQKEYSNTYMVCLVNKARQQAGLEPLGMDDALTNAAQQHSDDMARMNNMDHTGSDGSSPGDRCQRAGFPWTAVAENIAYGQNSMDEVMQVWMDSPGHRENILNSQYTMMGSAVSMGGGTPYYTQNFACDGKAVRNVPTCDGDYPDMSAPGQASSGGNRPSSYGNQQSGGGSGGGRRRGGAQTAYGGGNNGGDQPMRYSDNSNGGSSGGRRGGRYGNNGGRRRQGGFGGSDMFNDDQWFSGNGFGQSPFGGNSRHGRGNRGGNGDMFSNMAPLGGFNMGGFGGFRGGY